MRAIGARVATLMAVALSWAAVAAGPTSVTEVDVGAAPTVS